MAGETILIIEDDPVMLRGLSDNFVCRGYHVASAADGESGLEAALVDDADLILLDIMLPGVNGFEICRQVRDAGRDVPIIMLTAKGQEDDVVRGLNLGADDYVTKPFSIHELAARVRAFLRRRDRPESAEFLFGNFRLDLRSHRLLRQGVELTLTPKEFKLLELFLQRADRALTREEILRRVWGHGILVTTRSVDRCVTTLRAKVESDPRHPVWIRTIRDVGYRFELPSIESSGGVKR